jgi:hypothetical protein
MNRKFNSFNEFYEFYLKEHSKPKTRFFHCLGSLIGLSCLVFALISSQWALIFWGLLVGYGLAWLSHFIVEKNRPATIKYPLQSFAADFRMLLDTLTGRVPITKEL